MPSKRRIARSLVTLLALTSINLTSAIFFTAPSSIAYTQGTATAGTSYGGTGGSLNAANQNCTNGAVVAIGATKSGSNLNSFMFVCKGFNNDGAPSGTEAVTNVFSSPSESDRCQTGQIGIGIRAIASNGGTLIGGVGLICGKPWLQTSQDVRDIKPDASSAGTVYTYVCPDGQLLAGFYLRTGSLVDQITPKCSTFTGFVFAAVGSPTIVSSGPHTASISFTGPTTGLSNPAETYTVTAVPASGPTITATGLTSTISVPGLASYMSYTITVTGANSFGNSASTGNAVLSLAPLPENETDTAFTSTQTGDSASQYAYVAHSSNLVLTDSLTIEAWVRPTGFNSGGWSMVVNKETSYELGITSASGSGIGYWSYGLRGSNWSGVTTDVRVVLNEWHHVAITRLAGENIVKFYLDGQLAYTGTADGAGTTAVTDQSRPLAIGARWGDGSGYQAQFTGQIDHVAIFSTARTQANIKSDMKTYGLRNQPGLKAYFDFNETTGSTVYNRISGAPATTDLTLIGSNLFTDVKIVETSTVINYTLIKFPRTYLNSVGGWKPPTGVTKISALIVGGGGGGGGGYQGGGGGAGGFLESTVAINPNSNYEVIVGTGGQGAKNPTFPTNGENSSAFTMTAFGGGAGMSEFTVSGNNQQSDAQPGGSGGGASHGTNRTGGSGTVGQGNSGANGPDIYPTCSEFAGGGGGGAGSAGFIAVCSDPLVSNLNHAGYGGSPKLSYVTNNYYAGGGGGSLRGVNGTALKRGKGGNGDATTSGDGAYSADVAFGSTGSATSAPANSGGGGGAGSSVDGTKGYGGSGGSGFVAVRWITATVPSYTKPTNAFLNVGMTETFTTNVLVDSATANLTRTFRWESTTPTSNGAYTLIKQGTGETNAAFSWIPADTSTSGSGFLYRLIVTDSDTAGLSITDSSTAYAVINRALVVSGTTGIAKTINVARSETFTITLGTSTYKTTLTSFNPGISLDTSTATSPVIKVSETMTVGTYFETLTVTDSVSASVITPLTIVVSAPPNLLNTSQTVVSDLVFHIEPGNSASYTPGVNAIRDISGANRAVTMVGTPTYSNANSGVLQLSKSQNQSMSAPTVPRMDSWTVEAFIRIDSDLTAGSCIVTNEYTNTLKSMNFALCIDQAQTIYTGYHTTNWNFARTASTDIAPTGVWTHIVGVYDGANTIVYLNGVNKALNTANNSGTNTPPSSSTGTFVIGNYFDRAYTNLSLPATIGYVKIFKRGLSLAEIQQEFNATKSRFLSENTDKLYPSQKYGTSNLETFTATSGYGAGVVSYSTGNKSGVVWSTSGETTTLRMQESLTAITHYDTITVTDSLGASTYLPIKMTVSKADTLTVTVGSMPNVTYSTKQIITLPAVSFSGIAGVDTFTANVQYRDTVTATLTCAQGGLCNLWDVGPGGGIVVSTIFTHPSVPGISYGGPYIELAPANWWGESGEYQTIFSNDLSTTLAYAPNISMGAKNNKQIFSVLGEKATAVNKVINFTFNGKSDWYIPSADELRAAAHDAAIMGLGNFQNGLYWTSSESEAAMSKMFAFNPTGTPSQIDARAYESISKNMSLYLRPVRSFGPARYESFTAPTNAATYTLIPELDSASAALAFNYSNVVYNNSSLTIDRAKQAPLTLNMYGAVAGSPFTLQVGGGSGDGAITETVTAGGTASNCAINNHVLSNSNNNLQQVTCNVQINKALSQNYLDETLTATVYFMIFVNNMPTNQVGGGTTIGLNGINSVWVDPGAAPTITGPGAGTYSASSPITITGSGFSLGPITVKFERNQLGTNIVVASDTSMTVTIPAGARSGVFSVTNRNGTDFSSFVITIG